MAFKNVCSEKQINISKICLAKFSDYVPGEEEDEEDEEEEMEQLMTKKNKKSKFHLL